ncbi:sugar phosphate isomerase/epimerase and 4-hydroxyphenylpyruvate domain-containing protein [Lysinibacter sp. HNR]|uniref:sugar phosphate isomerase/epimerase and 4-hydroxyphenylpyruvate domain-containing protein n=1 Tax=Lysinibacter sp. HNR TaxID=3031408 RepID=UPI002434E944|nr:sugar phosphate isomerase/epimerase and 4-hydroxyphenylpyruvate domain-containing protein [Lysinibacter sp. HNR]WGD36520.1 TIM barrel protein [Lysinibacter sp. HNR]
MKKSLATVCLSGTIASKLRAAAEAGFDGVELFEPDLIVSPETPQEIRKRATDLGLTLYLYQPFRDLEGVTEERFRANLRQAEAKFQLMDELGINTLLLCSNVATAVIDDDALAASQLYRLGEIAERYGIRVAYEALAWGRFVNGYEHSYRIVEAASHPNIGVCLDSFHILSRQHDPLGIEGIPGDKIFFVQLADALPLTMDVLSWSRHHRNFPGEGTFQLGSFMSHVIRAGYSGPLSLEVFNDVFRQVDSTRTALDAMRSLVWLEDQTLAELSRLDNAHTLGTSEYSSGRLRVPGTPSAARDAGSIRASGTLQALPLVTEPLGMNFIEVNTAHPHTIKKLLHELDFTLIGTRPEPPAQLWAQGEARIIVRTPVEQSNDPAIVAVGFTVADPGVSEERAIRLRAHPSAQSSRAIQAPDGTDVFLCDASVKNLSWTTAFSASSTSTVGVVGEPPTVSENAPTGSGRSTNASGAPPLIERIDHINLTHSWQHFDEAVLFYSSVLSLHPQATEDVAGLIGLVRSQSVSSENGAVRLLFSLIPPLAEIKQPSDHPIHIAFTTGDVVSVARRARDRGMRFLPVPENYYADVQARYDLPLQTLDTMREFNLLYDRDERGEYLHFYTATVDNLFFEVVERRNGYAGYGAANAPVRLAAQHTT